MAKDQRGPEGYGLPENVHTAPNKRYDPRLGVIDEFHAFCYEWLKRDLGYWEVISASVLFDGLEPKVCDPFDSRYDEGQRYFTYVIAYTSYIVRYN
jgi:hypothetical protein